MERETARGRDGAGADSDSKGTVREHAVLLIDRECVLCNRAVNWLVLCDRKGALHYGGIQSDAGRALLRAHGHAVPDGIPETVLLVDGTRVYSHSDAVLMAARKLGVPWRWFAMCAFGVPRVVRDRIYRYVARNRIAWFGREEACPVPSRELRERMIG